MSEQEAGQRAEVRPQDADVRRLLEEGAEVVAWLVGQLTLAVRQVPVRDMAESVEAARLFVAKVEALREVRPPSSEGERTDDVRVALGVAAKWFREYEESHRFKARALGWYAGDPGASAADEKAERNRVRAEFCEAALRSTPSPSEPVAWMVERQVVEGGDILRDVYCDTPGKGVSAQDFARREVEAARRVGWPMARVRPLIYADTHAGTSPSRGREPEWRTMESAPRDGTMVFAAFAWPDRMNGEVVRSVGTMYWTDHNGGGWVRYCSGEPTHWLPLPAPPAGDTGGAG